MYFTLADIICEQIEIFLMFLVYLSGSSSRGQGNVFAYNPTSGVVGPVCDDYWDISDVITISFI